MVRQTAIRKANAIKSAASASISWLSFFIFLNWRWRNRPLQIVPGFVL